VIVALICIFISAIFDNVFFVIDTILLTYILTILLTCNARLPASILRSTTIYGTKHRKI